MNYDGRVKVNRGVHPTQTWTASCAAACLRYLIREDGLDIGHNLSERRGIERTWAPGDILHKLLRTFSRHGEMCVP